MGLFFSPEIEKARDRAPAPEGVTLWELLEVQEKFIPMVCRVAVLRIPLWWVQAGRPAGKVALSCFLHEAINRCVREGNRYPKVCLLRLKQMQRAEWTPRDYSREAIRQRSGFQSLGEFVPEDSEDLVSKYSWDDIMR